MACILLKKMPVQFGSGIEFQSFIPIKRDNTGTSQ